MTKYFYRAVKNQKELVTGYIDANDSNEAKEKVKSMGFMPAGIYEEKLIPKKLKESSKTPINKLNIKEQMLFTSELQMLINSGISVLDALDSITRHAPSRRVSVFAEDLSNKIKSGKTLSESIENYSEIVGNIYVALVKAGEESGTLPVTLKYLSDLLKKKDDLKTKVIQMSIYPTILIVTMTFIFFLTGGLIFPKMVEAFSIEASEIPILAKLFMGTVSFISKSFILLILAGVAGWFTIFKTIGWKEIFQKLSDFLMNIPLISDCIRYISLSHYMSVLYVAYEAGVNIIKTLTLAKDTITNNVIKKQASEVISSVEKGENITDAFYKSSILPSVMMSMISTGEKTGQLGQMFKNIATATEKKLDDAISALSKAFEPILIILIGLFVAIIAIAMIQMYTISMSSLL